MNGGYIMTKIWLAREVTDHIASLERSAREEEIGRGSYLVPAPEKGIGRRRSVHIRNLTYREFVSRALHCIEATWVPNKVMEELAASERTGGDCGDACRESFDCSLASECPFCDPFSGCE